MASRFITMSMSPGAALHVMLWAPAKGTAKDCPPTETVGSGPCEAQFTASRRAVVSVFVRSDNCTRDTCPS